MPKKNKVKFNMIPVTGSILPYLLRFPVFSEPLISS